MYKQILEPNQSISTTTILRIADMAFIPVDSGNIDYQAYLKWLEEGNTPIPADE